MNEGQESFEIVICFSSGEGYFLDRPFQDSKLFNSDEEDFGSYLLNQGVNQVNQNVMNSLKDFSQCFGSVKIKRMISLIIVPGSALAWNFVTELHGRES